MAGAMRHWWWVKNLATRKEHAPVNQTQQGRCRARSRSRRGPERAPCPRHRARTVGSGQGVDLQQDADWQEVLAALPGTLAELEAVAREQGALRRRRAVRGAADLLRLVLVYAVGDFSLRLTAAWATVAGVAELSDEGLLWRLRHCLPWLQTLVTARLAAGGVDLPRAAGGRRLRIIDGSGISGPGSAGTDWRVHLDYDPVGQRLTTIAVTDAHGGESLTRYAFAPDDIVLADRGFCRARGIAHVREQTADVVVRLNTGALPLFTAADAARPLDLAAWLKSAPTGQATERPVWITVPATADQPARWLPVRLLACRLPAVAANTARRRLRQQATKHGRTPTQLSLQAAGFVLLLTSLDAQEWSAADVLALYRFRWQIELVFKRWKGLLGLGHLRTQDDTLAQVCLLARLLVALVIEHWSAALPLTFATEATAAARPCSLWRCFAAWVAHARQAILGHLSLAAWLAALPRLQRYLCDSPRQRPSQAHAARTFQHLTPQTNRATC